MEGAERYGPYLVYEQIGKGGMATVHRAELTTKRGVQQIALKRMLPTMQRELVAVFLDEARLLKSLHHPNIPATFDSGRHFGTYFIAMEYVRGPTLKELVAHCATSVGTVPQPITLNLAAQLCEALDHAHQLGIIHRDVSPANILLSESGLLKLIDFGLAKAQANTEHTAVGVIKGKFGYVAPEYLSGKLDHRADLWAVGIIMYELLTNRRLFDGPDAFETMMRVRELPIPRPSLANPKVTPELDAIVMTALQRDPDRRWPSAAAMRDRIAAVIAQPGNALDGAGTPAGSAAEGRLGSIDNRGVIEWVDWAFAQKAGRPPQLTPMVPMPITPLIEPLRSSSIERDDPTDVDPVDVVRLPPYPASARAVPHIVWYAALVVIVLASILYKLVR